MHHDRHAEALGRLDDRSQLGLGVGRPGRLAAHRGVGVDLDPVGAAADLVADDPDEVVAVGLLDPLRDRQLGREALRPVAAGRGDRSGRDDHPGARDDPLLDRPLQPDVGITGALGPEVADRREARLQDRPEVDRRPRHPQRQRLLQDLIVPRRLVVGVQQDVRMGVDQARQQGRPRQIDRLRVGRGLDVSGRPDRRDPRAADEHEPALVGRAVARVEDPVRPQQEARPPGLLGRRRPAPEGQQGGDRHPMSHDHASIGVRRAARPGGPAASIARVTRPGEVRGRADFRAAVGGRLSRPRRRRRPR